MRRYQQLIQRVKEARRRRTMTVTCQKCHHPFNAEKQAGICPHMLLKDFLSEPVANSWSTSIKREPAKRTPRPVGTIYVKGSGTLGVDRLYHIAVPGSQDADCTVATLCGYPEFPESPRHDGRLQPTTTYVGEREPTDLCALCHELQSNPVEYAGDTQN